MEDKNEKFSEMAVKNPSKAVFYGMGIVILFLLGLWGKKEIRISELEEEIRNAKAEAKKESAEQYKVLIAIYAEQLRKSEEKSQAQDEQIIEMSEKVESLLTKSSANDRKYGKIENKIDRMDKETKKIEEVIQQ